MGKARLEWGFEKTQIDGLISDPLAKRFLERYKTRATKHEYSMALCLFFNWLRLRKGLVFSPSGFLEELMRRRNSQNLADRQWGLELVLEFSRDNPELAKCCGSRKYHLFSVVRSFCRAFEVDLTSDENPFGKRGGRKHKPKQMSMDLAGKVLGVLPQRERAICIIMLQSGMGAGDVLYKFNFMRKEIESQLRPGIARLKVDLPERKGNGLSYFTYISVDAIQELRKWFAVREGIVQDCKARNRLVSDAVFIKNNGGAFDLDDFEGNFTYHIQKHKLNHGPWSLSSHMFRKLFKTESRPPERGIDSDCVEFMMGHLSGIESVGGIYDRTPELYEGVIEKEYGKLEKYLNIYSQRSSDGFSDSDKKVLDLLRDPEAFEFLRDLLRKRKASA